MSAILPEETTRTSVFQIPDYCCEPWFRVQYLQDVDWLDPAWRNHSPDCNVARIFRRIEGEEPVTILNGVEGESSDSVLVWKESLPLTLLDNHREAFGTATVYQGDQLLGTADGRIGIATPEIIKSFNLMALELAIRFRFHDDRAGEPCRYALEPIESNRNRFAYHEQANASMYFTSDDGMFPVSAKGPSFQEIILDKTIRKFNGGFFKCAVLPNGRWVVYDPERYATFQKDHDNA